MKYAAKTITGIRKQNQDAVFIPESGMIAIAAVADGMGGHNAGDIASALAIKTLVENMHKNAPGTIRERLINAVNMANSAVYELSFSDTAAWAQRLWLRCWKKSVLSRQMLATAGSIIMMGCILSK